MNVLSHIVDGGSGTPLSPKGEAVLRFLMDRPNTIHLKDDIAASIQSTPGGRAIDTYISEIRKALGAHRDSIIVAHGRGAYGWIGDSVTLVPTVKSIDRESKNDPMAKFAVMTRADVAKRLGITAAAVGMIENAALRKLRAKPEMKEMFRTMLSETRRRVHYDPFYECWLFSVQEQIAYAPVEEETDEE